MRRILFLIFAVSLSLKSWADIGDDALLGRWSYKVENAPYEYATGGIEFLFEDDHLSAVVSTNGTKIRIYRIDRQDENYTCSLYVDNTLVELIMQIDGDLLKGKAIADNSTMNITFTRELNSSLRISIKSGKFVDKEGREVLFNGINHVNKNPDDGYVCLDDPKTFRKFKEYGFNIVRYGIHWDRLESKPGVFDVLYLEEIDKRVQLAKDNGM